MSDRRFIAAVLSMLAATVHAGLTPDHFRHAPWLGLAFTLAAVGQTLWAVEAVRGRDESRLRVTGLALNGAILLAYLASRTIGLPGQPVEPVAALDALTAATEVTLGVLVLSRVPRWAEGAGLTAAAALLCLLMTGMATHG